MIRRLVEYAGNPNRLQTLVQVSPPTSITNSYNVRPSQRTTADIRQHDLNGAVQATQAELIRHSISVLNHHAHARSIYEFNGPTLLLKTLDRGGAVVVYQLFTGMLMFTLEVLNVDSKVAQCREKASFEGEPEEVEIIRKDQSPYFARRRFLKRRERISESTPTRELMQESNKELHDFLMEVAMTKLCSLLKIGPDFTKPLGFDAVRYSDCLEYHLEQTTLPTANLLCQKAEAEAVLRHHLSMLHRMHITVPNIHRNNLLMNSATGELIIGRLSNARLIRQSVGYCAHNALTDSWVDNYDEDFVGLQRLLQRFNSDNQEQLPCEKREVFDRLLLRLNPISHTVQREDPKQHSGLEELFSEYFELRKDWTQPLPFQPKFNVEFVLRSIANCFDLPPIIMLATKVEPHDRDILSAFHRAIESSSPQYFRNRALLYLTTHSSEKFQLLFRSYSSLLRQQNHRLTQESFKLFMLNLRTIISNDLRRDSVKTEKLTDIIRQILEFQPAQNEKILGEGFRLLRSVVEERRMLTPTEISSFNSNRLLVELLMFIMFVQQNHSAMLALIHDYNLHSRTIAQIRWNAYRKQLGESQATLQLVEELQSEKYGPAESLYILFSLGQTSKASLFKQFKNIFDGKSFDLQNVENKPGLTLHMMLLCMIFLQDHPKDTLRNLNSTISDEHKVFCTMSSFQFNTKFNHFNRITEGFLSNLSFKRRLKETVRYSLDNTLNTLILAADPLNKHQQFQYYSILANMSSQVRDLQLAKHYFYEMLLIEGIGKMPLKNLDDALTFVKYELGLGHKQEETEDYKKKIMTLTEGINHIKDGPSSQHLLLIAYLWDEEGRQDYSEHFLKMAMQQPSLEQRFHHEKRDTEMWQWMALICHRSYRKQQFEKYLRKIEEVVSKNEGGRYERMMNLTRFLNLCQVGNNWNLFEKYLPMLEGVLPTDPKEPKLYYRAFEKMLGGLFRKGKYALAIKVAEYFKGRSRVALFYEGASFYHCHRMQKSLKSLLEFQKTPSNSPPTPNTTVMLADSSSIISHIYDKMGEVLLMEDYQIKALETYTQAAAMQPSDIYSNHQVAVYSMKLGQNLTALRYLRTVLKLSNYFPLNPRQFDYEIDMANCCGKLGLRREEEFHFDACSRLRKDAYVLLQLAKIYLTNKQRKKFYQTAAYLRNIPDSDVFTHGLRKMLKERQESAKLLLLYGKLPKHHMEHPHIIKILKQLQTHGSDIERSNSAAEHCAQLILCKKVRIEALTVNPQQKEIAECAQEMRMRLLR